MKIYKMKNILILSILGLSLLATIVSAQNINFDIIPDADQSDESIGGIVNTVGEGGKVLENYKDIAYGKKSIVNGQGVRNGGDLSLGDQLASGIMTWDTLLDYTIYLIKFIGQLALLVGALMIIYLGYKKTTEHIKFDGQLGKIVIGILVISFAFVIVKIIWSMFIS